MRRTLIAALVSVAMAVVAAPQAFGSNSQDDYKGRHDYPERDESHQTFELASGTRVAVDNINGRVEIETHFGDTAEVHIVRSARTRDDLNYRKVLVTQTGSDFIVRGEDDREHRNARVRQEVKLRVPRNITLSLNDINGHTSVGEIEGPVDLNDINGGVEIAQAAEYAEANDINGHLSIRIARLGSKGIRLNDINGGVELRFADDVNADLDVRDLNGGVQTDSSVSMTLEGKMRKSNFKARIGGGGAPITVSDVNGGLKIMRSNSAG